MIQSPKNRKIAMAAENTEYPAAAVPGPAFKTCFRYTAVQSAIAPSESKMQKPIALRASSTRGILFKGSRCSPGTTAS